MKLLAGKTMFACIVVYVLVTDTGKDQMGTDLFGDRSWILVQSASNFNKRSVVGDHLLNCNAFIKGKMFLISHVSTSFLPGHSIITIT